MEVSLTKKGRQTNFLEYFKHKHTLINEDDNYDDDFSDIRGQGFLLPLRWGQQFRYNIT
jgi:hypothetical protein